MRVNCIFGASAHSRATMECQKQREFDCLPTSSGRMRSWSFSVFAAFAVPVSSLHIYLASLERQSFLVCDGIQTLDMLSLGLGSKKDRFSSSRPISDSCASSLIIFTVRARNATTKCVGGIVASIAAFQAVDPGLIPGQRISLDSG